MSLLQFLRDRLMAEWRCKLWLTLILNLLVCVPYYYLQHNHFFPATVMRPTVLDSAIPFAPEAVWLYLSIYLFMPIAPLLSADRRQLVKYGIGMATLALVASIVFVFWPTWCERPRMAKPNFGYQLLTAADNPYHAFPSLHAAFTVFSLLCALRLASELRFSVYWKALLMFWAGLILWGTLATKQHVLFDLAGGSLLAIVVYFITVRKVASPVSICSNPVFGAGSTNQQL